MQLRLSVVARRLLSPGCHVAAVLVGYAVLFGLFFSPVLLEGKLLAPGDGITFWLPAFLRPRTWWTPLILSGFPIAAEPTLQTFYPLSWICARLGQWNAFIVSAYVIAAAGTYAYVFTLTRSVRAGFVAGIVFGSSGFLLAHLGHASIIHGAAWIPVILWSLERLRQRREAVWIAVAALAVANAIVGGHPQMWTYGLGLAGAYVAVVGSSAPSGRRWFSAWSILAVAIGVGLAAVQLMPAMELMQHAGRDELPFSVFVSFALPPRELLQLLFPNLLGTVPGSPYGIRYFGTTTITETAAYTGWVALGLAAIALRVPTDRAITRFWRRCALLALLFGLGDATPLARVVYHVPIYGGFRCPARAFVILTLAVATLAGIGMATLERGGQAARRFAAHGATALIGFAVLAGAALFFLRGWLRSVAGAAGIADLPLQPWHNPAIGVPLVFAAAGAAAIWLYGARPSRSLAAALTLLTLVDLASFGGLLEWRFFSPERAALEPPSNLEHYRTALAATHGRLLQQDLFGPVETAPPNRNILWMIPSARGLTSVPPQRYVDLALDVHDPRRSPNSRILDMLAVQYLVLHNAYPVPSMVDASRWRALENRDDLRVYENLYRLPRAWLVGQVHTLPPTDVLRSLRQAQLPNGEWFDPGTIALIEDPIDFPLTSITSADTVAIEAIEDTRMRVRTHTARAAFLVVSDAHYPGWEASIDGHPVPLYRTNYVLRGLAVPAGDHAIEMVFHPRSVWIGLGISFASLPLLAWTMRRCRHTLARSRQ